MPELEPGVKLLDLRTTAYQHLMDLSAASAPNPFGELLPFNPGVLPARLGYMTGALLCLLSSEQQHGRQRGACWLLYNAVIINVSVASMRTPVASLHVCAWSFCISDVSDIASVQCISDTGTSLGRKL